MEQRLEVMARSLFEAMMVEVHEVNVANGWFDEHRMFEADVALLHSEVSEMFEAWREHGFDDATGKGAKESSWLTNPKSTYDLAKPEGVGSEAADILIRLLDTVYRHDIDLVAEYQRKTAYNRTRGYRHGGKRL